MDNTKENQMDTKKYETIINLLFEQVQKDFEMTSGGCINV